MDIKTGVQFLIVVVTAACTLGVTLLVQYRANLREHKAVRRQVVALLESAQVVARVLYINKSIYVYASIATMLSTLATRFLEKDVALAFSDHELATLLRVQRLSTLTVEGCERYRHEQESNTVADEYRNAAFSQLQGMSRLLDISIHDALGALKIPNSELPAPPSHLPQQYREAT